VVDVTLVGVRVEVPSNQPIMLLRESAEPRRYLPIFIGAPEATAIVYALQGMETPRPMTHDLATTMLEDLGARLVAVEITELHEGTFFAELEIVQGDRTVRLSARPSDAMALAVRQAEPVTLRVAEDVIDEAGLHFDTEEDEEQIEEFREFLDQISPEDFV
jgi:bifunctional DNase/RNase